MDASVQSKPANINSINPAAGVTTKDVYETSANLPYRFNNPDSLKGYGPKADANPIYMTSNSEYGLYGPNVHTVSKSYHGLNQKFSTHMGQAGMSRRTGLNTAVDRSRVHNALQP